MNLLIQDVSGWSPGIGDPTPYGWFTVAAYMFAAVLTILAWRRARQDSAEDRVAFTWLTFGVLMVALGINKQLDLQSLFTVIARDLAKRQGWYEARRIYQRDFIFGMAIFFAATMLTFAWLLRHRLRQLWLAGLGIGFTCTFVVVRAASFHHVDVLLGIGRGAVNRIFEIGGIALVAAGALHYLRTTQTSRVDGARP